MRFTKFGRHSKRCLIVIAAFVCCSYYQPESNTTKEAFIYSIIIGSNIPCSSDKYDTLKYAEKTAETLKNKLDIKGLKSYVYLGLNAVRNNIRKKLIDLSGFQTGLNDGIYLWYFGHGQMRSFQNTITVGLPICPKDSMISIGEIDSILNKKGSGSLATALFRFAFIHSCYSGTFDSHTFNTASEYSNPHGFENGFYLISTGGYRSIVEDPEFYSYMFKGIDGDADCNPTGNADGGVSYFEFAKYLDSYEPLDSTIPDSERVDIKCLAIGSGDPILFNNKFAINCNATQKIIGIKPRIPKRNTGNNLVLLVGIDSIKNGKKCFLKDNSAYSVKTIVNCNKLLKSKYDSCVILLNKKATTENILNAINNVENKNVLMIISCNALYDENLKDIISNNKNVETFDTLIQKHYKDGYKGNRIFLPLYSTSDKITGMFLEDIAKTLHNKNAKSIIIILDVILPELSGKIPFVTISDEIQLQQLPDDFYLIMAEKTNEMEDSLKDAIADGLRGIADIQFGDNNHIVSFNELYTYLNYRYGTYAKSMHKDWQPPVKYIHIGRWDVDIL